MSGRNYAAAKPEYATAEIAVWWDMNDCRIPEGYDSRSVRPSIEAAFKKLGYFGPVSITAYADQKQTPDDILRGLSSTGVSVAHTKSARTCTIMFSDMLTWRGRNPPPATMMLISNQVEDVLSWDLARLQQETNYNLFLAYSVRPRAILLVLTSAEWLWDSLLDNDDKHDDDKCSDLSAPIFNCKSCNLDGQSLESFKKHLSTKKHAVEDARCSCTELDTVTRMWGKNYLAKPEHATAKIAVWWDMDDCPVPEGYDACWVRQSIEEGFKKLGYSGPVSITACGDLKQTPDRLLRGLSSTGVALKHTIPDVKLTRMSSDMMQWKTHNPPPATMMLISDSVEFFSTSLVRGQQEDKYNLFLAYSFRPYKMSVLVTSAEWLWDSLLAVSVSQTRRRVLQKCSERSETTDMFSCKLCLDDFKSFDDFMKHLSSDDLAQEEGSTISSIQSSELDHEFWLVRSVEKGQTFEESSPDGSCSSGEIVTSPGSS